MKYFHNLILRTSFFIFLLSAFAAPTFSASQPVEFYGAKAYANGGIFYHGMNSGDFDGDGKTDVLTSSYNTILVFYGDGSGGFSSAPVTAYAISGGDISSVAGDFNNDGRSDFAFQSSNPANNQSSIAVVFGGADRTFSQPIYSSQDPMPASMVPVDFNSDGKLDLLGQAEIPGSAVIIIYKGVGDGTFVAGGRLNTNYLAKDITTGDFNNDGLPDISYGDSDALKVSQNLGNGTFGAPVTVDSIDYGFNSIAIADINNDGKKDLVAVQNTFFNPVVAVWLGSASFTFTQSPDLTIQSTEDVYLQQIADINKDEFQDLIFSSKNRTIISNGSGNGAFAEADSYIDGGGDLIVGDLNFDNWLDIVAAQSTEFARVSGSGSFVVLLNQQDGIFRSAPALDAGDDTKDIAVSDFNADGLKDFVVVNRGGGGGPGEVILLFQANGASIAEKIGAARQEFSGEAGLDPHSVVTGDYNQDGKPDIVVVGHGAFGAANNALIIINQGNNNFVPELFQIGTGDIYDVATADFNSDGKLDLVTTGFSGVSVSFGKGDGTFDSPVTFFNNIPSNELAVGDFNNDAKTDIAAINYSPYKIGILISQGNGTFVNSSNLNVSDVPNDIAISDMNSDGKADLIVAKGNGVSVIAGVGNGSFNAEVNYKITPFSASGLSVADFNGDRLTDVALLAGSNTISVMLNTGAGALGKETLWGGGATLSTIAAGDFNNDQKNDLIFGFTASSSGYIKLLFNLTENQVMPRKVLFDFDGDGRADVSVFRPASGYWYLLNSSTGFAGVQFGVATDKVVPEDYDGDRKTDVAVYRDGVWYLLRSSAGFAAVSFGNSEDLPQPADFDGDGKAELAVYRPSTGAWYTLNLAGNQFNAVQFGVSSDKPVVGDYDGDGRADIAVYRPENGAWYLLQSTAGFAGVQFGISTDRAVPADYDGDGRTDIAVYRDGIWYLLQSTKGFAGFQFGTATDIPSPADYDGDGKADAAVFRDGNWYLLGSTNGFSAVQFGLASDKPVPNAFIR